MRRRPFSGSCIMQPLESVGNKDIPVLLYSGRVLVLGLLILHTVRHPAVWSAEDETRETGKKKDESCDCCRQNHNRNPMRIPHEQRRAELFLFILTLDVHSDVFQRLSFSGINLRCCLHCCGGGGACCCSCCGGAECCYCYCCIYISGRSLSQSPYDIQNFRMCCRCS